MRFFLLVALLLVVLVSPSAAQMTGDSALYQVRLTDGTSIVGRIVSRSPEQIVVVTLTDARFELKPEQIRDVREAHGRIVNGEFWWTDPNNTRLFFAPTARSVGQGQGYIGTFMVALPFVSYGLTDRITLAGGAPILFGEIQPLYIAPKIQVLASENLGVAVGVLSVFSLDGDDESVGVLFAVSTVGTSDRALTGGLGYGYAGDDIANEPVFTLGGETRVARRVKLITENYLVPGGGIGFFSGGLRVLGERFTTDIGILGGSDGDESFCCFPLINFSYAFGSRRMR